MHYSKENKENKINISVLDPFLEWIFVEISYIIFLHIFLLHTVGNSRIATHF